MTFAARLEISDNPAETSAARRPGRRPSVFLEERVAKLREMWPTTATPEEIMAALAELPGAPIPNWQSVYNKAAALALGIRPGGGRWTEESRVRAAERRAAEEARQPTRSARWTEENHAHAAERRAAAEARQLERWERERAGPPVVPAEAERRIRALIEAKKGDHAIAAQARVPVEWAQEVRRRMFLEFIDEALATGTLPSTMLGSGE